MGRGWSKRAGGLGKGEGGRGGARGEPVNQGTKSLRLKL